MSHDLFGDVMSHLSCTFDVCSSHIPVSGIVCIFLHFFILRFTLFGLISVDDLLLEVCLNT